MNIYQFSPGASPNWQASLMAQLNSYFCLGGETVTRIISLRPSGLILAKKEKAVVSTAEKILKILSFILFPLVLIALAIRYLLYNKFNKDLDRAVFFIPTEITKAEELIIAKNPALVKEAALTVSPLFYSLPKKYQLMKVETP